MIMLRVAESAERTNTLPVLCVALTLQFSFSKTRRDLFVALREAISYRFPYKVFVFSTPEN